jgi:hypothetical protein
MLTPLAHENYYNPGAGVVSLQARYRMWDPQQKQQHVVILLIKLARNTMLAITALKQFFKTTQQAAI